MEDNIRVQREIQREKHMLTKHTMKYLHEISLNRMQELVDK